MRCALMDHGSKTGEKKEEKKKDDLILTADCLRFLFFY
jgi:hypothetical protein